MRGGDVVAALAGVGVLDRAGLHRRRHPRSPLPVAVPPSPKLQVVPVGVHVSGITRPSTLTAGRARSGRRSSSCSGCARRRLSPGSTCGGAVGAVTRAASVTIWVVITRCGRRLGRRAPGSGWMHGATGQREVLAVAVGVEGTGSHELPPLLFSQSPLAGSERGAAGARAGTRAGAGAAAAPRAAGRHVSRGLLPGDVVGLLGPGRCGADRSRVGCGWSGGGVRHREGAHGENGSRAARERARACGTCAADPQSMTVECHSTCPAPRAVKPSSRSRACAGSRSPNLPALVLLVPGQVDVVAVGLRRDGLAHGTVDVRSSIRG